MKSAIKHSGIYPFIVCTTMFCRLYKFALPDQQVQFAPSYWSAGFHNSLWNSNNKWWHKSASTLAQVMAWCCQAPSHYLNNVDFSLVRFCDIHMRGNLKGVSKMPFYIMSVRIILLKLLPHLPGAHKLTDHTCSADQPPCDASVCCCPQVNRIGNGSGRLTLWAS